MPSPHAPHALHSPGRVYLVGAGPGDPDLVTLRGAALLAQADVVLFDYLVNPAVMRYAKPDSRQICLGKHGSGRMLSQEEVNREMIEAAKAGHMVVRLKGGDPAVFGRGAEEAEALVEAGIPFEIVPGVTAALAAGSYAGIPVTHRQMASAVAFVTGHECDHKDSQLDWASLATFPGTLVFYMGVTTVREWTEALMTAGKPADTPVAVVRRCSWPDQMTLRTTLGSLADEVEKRRLRPPVVAIVGEVVNLASRLNWFEKRPLFGQRIMVTRPRHQAHVLDAMLTELGADVVLQPAIEIEPPPSWEPVDQAIEQLEKYDWIVFSSANGVNYFLERLLQQADLRRLGHAKFAAVGPGTAEALAAYHLKSDVVPGEYRAEALAAALAEPARQGKSFLLIRASRGREVLAEELRAAGGSVEQVVCYLSRDITEPQPEVAAALAEGRIHWVTVTSSAIARNLHALFGEDLKRARLASISPVTSATLRELGLEPAAEATVYTMQGLADAIVRASSGQAGTIQE